MGDAATNDPVSSWTAISPRHDGSRRSNSRADQAPDNNDRPHDGPNTHNIGRSAEDQGNDSDDDLQYRSADEEEIKLATNEPSKLRKITQKKMVEEANFTQWLNTNRVALTTRPTNHHASQQEESLRYMVRSWEGGEKIIGTPRDYQLELFERAKRENTIAVLDTGSGKTLIAVLLIEHIINKELEDRKNGLSRRLSFFLVEKVALAFQQHAVLECNLPHPSAVFSGESTKYEWSKEFWAEELAKHEVIVCTAEILRQLLHHALINIDQINLLVFDEAHHTKKNHPYARIIKDFYVDGRNAGLRLPRIFGMTASPVDALNIDLRQAAAELEVVLDSRIATTADPDALKRAVSKPKKELVANYSPLCRATDTPLTAQLKQLVSSNKNFSKPFSFAESASRELGPWFVDRMWKLVLGDDQIPKLEAKTERHFTNEAASNSMVEQHKRDVQTAQSLAQTFQLAQPEDIHLSSKMGLLVDTLQKHFQDPSIRCIVFVEKRWTAKLLADYFAHYNTTVSGLKVGFLMGANSIDASSETSFREQIRTIIEFKKGQINCIFATSVAEEGLDIPDCNLIIRFDLCKTMIQYIQSRGRARQAESTYVQLVEEGNQEHARTVYQNSENEGLLRKFCNTLPEDRLLKGGGTDADMEEILGREKKLPTQTIEATGAKLSYYNSLNILQDFLNSLRNQDDFVEGMPLHADYSTLPVQGGFLCEIAMPASSPISNVRGMVYSTKQVAKCSAAFEACRRLIKGKFLDNHLRSRFAEKRRHVFASARLALSTKKSKAYDMRLKPLLWAELGVPQVLWATVLTLSRPNTLGRPSRPLLILTRTPLPQVKPVMLFFGSAESGMTSDMIPVRLNIPIVPQEEDLQLFTNYTLTIFNDIFNKRYTSNFEDMCYFFLPAKVAHNFPFSEQSDPRDVVDWALLRHVMEVKGEVYKGDEPDDFFKDKYIVDPYDGSRRFWLRGVRRDLKCRDPVPADVEIAPTYREWKKGEVSHNILNWSFSAWKKTRQLRSEVLTEDQPVVVGVFAPLRRDFLADLKEDRKDKVCYFALKPMRISSLAADAVAMAYLLPSIVHRIEQNLIALDACQLLQLNIHPDLALEALTQDSENQADDDGEGSLGTFQPINLQLGMGNNYERLEFLGDSFLKMSTTIAIFTGIPNKDEFDYHCERMVMICNKNLFNVALELKLQEYIRSKALERGTWYPTWKLEFGKTHVKMLKQMDTHSLADKSIADVCEALIGASYMTTRSTHDFTMAIQAVTRFVDNKRHTMKRWEDYYAAYQIPGWQLVSPNAAEVDMAQKIADITGYTFNYPRVLRSAFRHPSRPYVFDKVPTYQRMEFLGDALLDMECVDYLFHLDPNKGPQWLTEHKMAMVSNQFLGCLAVSLGFHKFIMHNQSVVGGQIMEYVTELSEARHAAEDEAEAAGLPRSNYAKDYWVEVAQPPKCIPDVLEAYLGAVFVDSEYDYSQIQSFFAKHMLPYFTDMRMYDTFANKHPVTFLTHFIFEEFSCNAYGIQSQETPVEDDMGIPTGQMNVAAAIFIHGKPVDGAIRESGRYAKVSAARKSMKKLRGMTKDDFINEYSCDCKSGETAEELNETANSN